MLINEFDVVKVKELPTDETKVKVGDVGSVIMVLDDDAYEVEFVNKDGRTYGTLSLKESQLEKIY
jgi:hypothetical protein